MSTDRGREFYIRLEEEGRFPPRLAHEELQSFIVLTAMSYLRKLSDEELADFFDEVAQQVALANKFAREKDYVPSM